MTAPARPAGNPARDLLGFCIPARNRHPRSFTLIELITVIVILAVTSGLVVPRLMSWDTRRSEASVEAVAELLSTAARRGLFSSERFTIRFDGGQGESGRLSLLVLRRADARDVGFEAGDERWLEDPLAPPVELDGITLIEATTDGAVLSPREFSVELPPDGARPEILLRLDAASGTNAWYVLLPPGADAAAIGRGAPPRPETRVDLDGAGRREDPW